MLVSILLLTYNHSKYITDALKSIVEQTYRSIELIVLDDFSTDQTVEIIKHFLESNEGRFFNVKIMVHDSNVGNIPKNCNEMIRHSRGEYIFSLSGDDVLMPDCIERLVGGMNSNSADMIFADEYIVDEDYTYGMPVDKSKRWSFDCLPLWSHRGNDGFEFPGMLDRLFVRNYISATTVMLKRETVDRFGYYDEDAIYEDWEYWMRMASMEGKIYYIHRPVAFYRRSFNSVTFIDVRDESYRRKVRMSIEAEFYVRDKYAQFITDNERREYAWDEMARVLVQRSLDANDYETIDYIRRELDLRGIRVSLDWDCIDKHRGPASSSIELKDLEIRLLTYWILNGTKWITEIKKGSRIAIYGYAKIGRILERFLGENQIKPSYIIDQKKYEVYDDYPIYSIEDELPPIDIIIVTLLNKHEQLVLELKKKTGAEVLDLIDVLA